jgi:hypothetical protein
MTIRAPRVLTGALSAVGASSAAVFKGEFSFWVYGTFVGTVQLEASFDNGVTWVALYSTTSRDRKLCDEPEDGILYRVSMTAYTSGTANFRISQKV